VNIRIITGSTVNGKVWVRAIACHKCGNDTWRWLSSQPALFTDTGDVATIERCECLQCKEKISFEKDKFLLEALDEKDGWFSMKRKSK